MNILMIGDVVGAPGRQAVRKLLPELRRRLEAEFVVVNCENAAHGKGITESTAKDLFDGGADVLTSGNHVFAAKPGHEYIDREERLLRPINFPPGTLGRGSGVFQSAANVQVAVINCCGRVFMENFDDPFRALDREVTRLSAQTPVILVDFHAEATSEKSAIGWFLDGRVTAVVGTHTHVPTADERLLEKGTAFISDLGMTGPYDSAIGVDKETIISAMRSLMPHRFEVATGGRVRMCGVLIRVDPSTGRAQHIERVREEL